MAEWQEEIRRQLAPLELEPTRELEIVEELSQHLQDRYCELISGLVDEAKARRLVLAELSGSHLLARELRPVEQEFRYEPVVLGAPGRKSMTAGVWQDVRYGWRAMVKHPGFTSIAVMTLALGIGANTTIFGLLNAMLLRPLPGISEPDRLVQIGQTKNGSGFYSISYADYRDYREQASTLDDIAAESKRQFSLGTDTTAERIKGSLVSGNYFDVLGVRAGQGRLLQPSDAEVEGGNPVAVISERLWQKHFDRQPDIAGSQITLNSHSYTIIGVAADFNGTSLEATAIWIPITMWRHANPATINSGVDLLNSRRSQSLELLGLLKPGMATDQAQVDLSAIAERLGEAYPDPELKSDPVKRGARVLAANGWSAADRRELNESFGIQFGTMVIVLLIACANVAGLLLARGAARHKEIGVRLALGAGRWRIVRQLMTESAMMAVIGGVIALLVAFWLSEWLRAAVPNEDLRALLRLTVDMRVLGFTLGLSLITALIFGLSPALHTSKVDLIPLLKDSGSIVVRHRRTRLRSAFVITQVALSLVLLVSAGLCVRSLQNAEAIDLGLAIENVVTAKLDIGLHGYSEAQGRAFYRQLLDHSESMPGVHRATLALGAPLDGSPRLLARFEGGQDRSIRYNVVSPNYLDTMGIPLLLGRHFTQQDDAQSPRVAIINQTFANSAWPNENPIGKYFKSKEPTGDLAIEVIGVAQDVNAVNLFYAVPLYAYLPLGQNYEGTITLHLHASSRPEHLLASLQQEIRALDPKLPIYNANTLEQSRGVALWERRFQASLMGGFGLLALALASLGLYGVLSQSAMQRTREIGIRMALGATAGDVRRLIVGQGLILTAIGLVLGLAGSLAATRVLNSLLFGVSATDPLTFTLVALLLASVALVACWIPARRATRVDPLIALRHE